MTGIGPHPLPANPIHQALQQFHLSSLLERLQSIPIPLSQAHSNVQSLTPFLLSKYHSLRRHFHKARRDVSAALSNITLLATLFTLLIFFLGAESSFREKNLPNAPTVRFTATTIQSYYTRSTSPLISQLHDFHSVPQRYIQLLTPHQQQQLLILLSSPVSNTTLSTPTRRAVFTHVTKCSLHPCLRAIASAMTYAQITSRVAVIFVDAIQRRRISRLIKLSPNGLVNHDAMIISLDQPVHDFHGEAEPVVDDWAEFTVIHAVAPSTLELNISTTANIASHAVGSSGDPQVHNDGVRIPDQEAAHAEESMPKIGNTNTVATMDNLAALDTHVSLSLSEVVWSRYAPRTVQEMILDNTFKSNPGVPQRDISFASILGRHRDTRCIRNTDSLLHKTYEIPKMLLRGMTPFARKLLLLKLQSKKRKGIAKPSVIFAHTQYGLGNRLRALGSAMAFARRTDRVLVLIWVPDQHLNCFYTDLFATSDEFVVSNMFSPREEWPFPKNFVADAAMRNVKWYNYMRVNGVKVNSTTDLVTDDADYHIYVSTCYVIQSPVTPFIIRTTSSYWYVLRSLTPHVDVVRLVERFASYPVHTMIGIHIRGKSIKKDIHGVKAADYTEESSRTTDYWRNLTQVDTFIEEMRRQTADQQFYVAADQKEVFARLEKEFPSRVFYTARHCDSRDRDCLPFALADILLLAKCASLRGSYWSSFSELSTRIGGARFLLAGIDFGRPL